MTNDTLIVRNRVANDTFVWSNNNDLFFGIKRTGESVFLPWRLCVIRVDVAMAVQCTSNNKAHSLVQQGQAAPGSQVSIKGNRHKQPSGKIQLQCRHKGIRPG